MRKFIYASRHVREYYPLQSAQRQRWIVKQMLVTCKVIMYHVGGVKIWEESV